MRVEQESPNQTDVIALIAELDAYQDSLYPAEARYALDLTSLSKPNVLFVVARNEQRAALGCGAVVLNDLYGEVKRMYVRPEARNMGVARHVIAALEAGAYKSGCRELMLETGPYQPEALRFYGRHGYMRRGAFGAYPEHPLSVFMGKSLCSPTDHKDD
ncbi:GNAT family N-acetyltransferase [Pseudomonas sp. LPB0260]|jgi:putative acetyltransferase|uniref:GNAT family N-acetyltransferase n=1 Tax=Pseudomonas sp. LPB0260 TaxID=2614442 RepID=UPI0015C20C1F|nr:GNAT family N-acetyltransferase [Pseudomonas sp. LPB0260]QLC73771.1 GNAT family N-acetyltransferase [Pseudomonas sp. LPB0260]QLC76545.1 GNAT family N-acetyltransferase [Pseudomonas sp. LPB0260]